MCYCVHACVYVSMNMFPCTYACTMFLYVRMCNLYVSLRPYMYVFACIYMYLCVFPSVCLHVFLHVCTCVPSGSSALMHLCVSCVLSMHLCNLCVHLPTHVSREHLSSLLALKSLLLYFSVSFLSLPFLFCSRETCCLTLAFSGKPGTYSVLSKSPESNDPGNQ